MGSGRESQEKKDNLNFIGEKLWTWLLFTCSVFLCEILKPRNKGKQETYLSNKSTSKSILTSQQSFCMFTELAKKKHYEMLEQYN